MGGVWYWDSGEQLERDQTLASKHVHQRPRFSMEGHDWKCVCGSLSSDSWERYEPVQASRSRESVDLRSTLIFVKFLHRMAADPTTSQRRR
jgi:hypothetical protein